MPVIKFSSTTAASLCKWWLRHITTSNSSRSHHESPSNCGWRITRCVHMSIGAQDKGLNSAYVSNVNNNNSSTININSKSNNKPKLGFGIYNNKSKSQSRFALFSTNKFYSGDSNNHNPNSSSSSSSSSGSGLLADMGSDYNNQQSPPPPSFSSSMHNHNHNHHKNKLLTLPTILTLGRVVAVPLLISTFYVDSWLGRTATTSIFIAAAFTDWLDGYLARKMKLGSVFGAFLDPVADKLMVAATLVLLCTRPLDIPMFGQVPWLLTVPAVAIIGREITMSAVREWAASQNTKLLEAVAVNSLGKWKTATQMIALTILLATRESSLANQGILVASGVALLYTSAGLSLWSLAVYMGKISKVLLR